ncbi:MAG TPA: hypothetical protein VIS48_06000 [Candidatus Kryptonia bacterium]
MPSYTVRVELHTGTEQDYEELHGYMEAQGFERTITGDDKKECKMPPAEYVMRNVGIGIDIVLSKANNAAALTFKSHAVLVSETTQWKWINLDTV